MKYINNIDKILKHLGNLSEDIGNEIGITEVANIQANTPVDSGTLKRSIAYESKSNNDMVNVIVGVDGNFVNSKNGKKVGDYAKKVEYENTSYLRDTIKGDERTILNIIVDKIKDL